MKENQRKMQLQHNREVAPYYSTKYGTALLGDARHGLALLPDESVDLVLSSPPFALTSKKEYGNPSEDRYAEWFLGFAGEVQRILKPEGSFVIDLGGSYLPGVPVRSIYVFELLVRLVRETGFHLAQELYHFNPARLPAPAAWVTIRRVRVKDSVNVVWWLSKTPHPKADNRKVLQPYSQSMRRLLRTGCQPRLRPSGHIISRHFCHDNGGAIPSNVLQIANTDSNSDYHRKCRRAGIRMHPARFPPQFAEFFIKFLTDEGDVVLDMFAGSNTTGYVAESLKRRWYAIELSEEYLAGSALRFDEVEMKTGA